MKSSVHSVLLSLTMSVPAAAQSLVEKGDMLYHNRCAGCHGDGLKAFAGAPAFDLRRLRPDDQERFVQFFALLEEHCARPAATIHCTRKRWNQ